MKYPGNEENIDITAKGVALVYVLVGLPILGVFYLLEHPVFLLLVVASVLLIYFLAKNDPEGAEKFITKLTSAIYQFVSPKG